MSTSQWMDELFRMSMSDWTDRTLQIEVNYRESLYDHYHEPSDEYIRQVYGLEPDEWVGSSVNRVRTIINKNSPHMEQQVNSFLRDQVAVFDSGMERLDTPKDASFDLVFDLISAHSSAHSFALRNAINEASRSGVLIDAETMSAIKQVERDYVIPFGGESLTRQYDRLRELNDARKHDRETVSMLASSSEKKSEPAIQVAQDVDRFSVITGGSGHGKEQVQLANVLSGRMLSMGRGTDGQSLAPSTPSQGSRQGSIAAALPGSSIAVGRRTPRVASHTGTSAAERYGLVADEAQQHEDDGFEL